MTLLTGNCLEILPTLPENSVQCCVTSPPYWGLRDYGVGGQLGLEKTPEEYVANMVAVFREVRRVLGPDATLWLNLGDSYAGSGPSNHHNMKSHGDTGRVPSGNGSRGTGKISGLKPKDLVGIPWRVAFALQADGWYLRSDIIWAKPNPMPESVRDRPTRSHEYVFLLTKKSTYYYDADAIAEESSGNNRPQRKNGDRRDYEYTGDGAKRNKRDVWTVTTHPYPEAHFATFPPKLIEPCILAGSRKGDTVLDPFCGAGTTGLVALKYHRDFIGIELNPEYVRLTENRLSEIQPVLT